MEEEKDHGEMATTITRIELERSLVIKRLIKSLKIKVFWCEACHKIFVVTVVDGEEEDDENSVVLALLDDLLIKSDTDANSAMEFIVENLWQN